MAFDLKTTIEEIESELEELKQRKKSLQSKIHSIGQEIGVTDDRIYDLEDVRGALINSQSSMRLSQG